MKIILVAAMTADRLIGIGDQLPWDIPEEMMNFREYTSGKTIVMGRKTYAGIGRALPKRRNIMLTRSTEPITIGKGEYQDGKVVFKKSEIEIYNSTEEVMKACENENEVLILGGSQVYEQFLPVADELRISEIKGDYTGDRYFPEIPENFQESSREEFEQFDVVTYQKS